MNILIPDKEPELLPCPFCGGNVRVWHNLETENYDIECQKCGCDVQQHYGCKDEAIEAWNTRTQKGGEINDSNESKN